MMFQTVKCLVVVFVCIINTSSGLIVRESSEHSFLHGTFPNGFMWGTATSAHQVEGAWNLEGKSQNIWDTFSLERKIAENQTAFQACDSYHKIQEDVALLKSLKVSFYRFSISWSRVLPDGKTINEAGLNYYSQLIDALMEANIQPMVTLYHWDLPQILEDQGGFLNESMLIDHFILYSKLCFEQFGDRVKWWITFNDPWIISHHGYGVGIFAPGIWGPGTSIYTAAHTLLKAHAEAWHLYDSNYRSKQAGKISISLNGGYNAPLTKGKSNLIASERAMQFDWGWFAKPIFVDGDYPKIMKKRIAERSSLQGYNESRLPRFTEEEKQRIKGTWDFLGVNHYSSSYVYDDMERPIDDVSFDADKGIGGYIDPNWKTTGSDWLHVTPYYFRHLLRWIKSQYNNPPIIITENGVSDRNGTLQDHHRIEFFKLYTNELLKAIELDKCNIIGYTAWSLMDSFEWLAGYTEKFGLFHVDFESSDRNRTAKESASFYTKLIENNGYPDPKPKVATKPVQKPVLHSSAAPSLSIHYILIFLLCGAVITQ